MILNGGEHSKMMDLENRIKQNRLYQKYADLAKLAMDPTKDTKEKFREAQMQAAQMDILMTVLMVIVGAVALYVGLLIISNVEGSLPNETTDSATFDTISSNVDSAFVLIGVGFIVVAAGFIIGALITRLAPGLFNMNNGGK